MKKEIKWTLQNGKEAKITVKLVLNKIVNADGDKIMVPCCEINISAEVEGLGSVGFGNPNPVKNHPKGIVASIGKLGMLPEQFTLVKAAIAEAEAAPEWIAKQELIERNKREWSEIKNKRRANGLCPKCETYCYGDCEAN